MSKIDILPTPRDIDISVSLSVLVWRHYLLSCYENASDCPSEYIGYCTSVGSIHRCRPPFYRSQFCWYILILKNLWFSPWHWKKDSLTSSLRGGGCLEVVHSMGWRGVILRGGNRDLLVFQAYILNCLHMSVKYMFNQIWSRANSNKRKTWMSYS